MPIARCGFGSAIVNDKVYIIGGELLTAGTKSGMATVEEYDPATDTWSRKSDMLTPRRYCAASALDGKIYVFGGTNAPGDAVPTVEEYNPNTDTWMQRSDTPTERRGHSSSVVDGKIYIIGGAAGDIYLSLVEEYIPGSESVEARDKLPTKWGEVKSD